MKILFLDIDGVLNDHRAITCEASNLLAPQVRELERVIQATGCKIVLSSAWRYVVEPEQMQDWLRERGAPSAEVIGRTPTGEEMGLATVEIPGGNGALMYWTEVRGNEIARWLGDNHQSFGQTNVVFAIVDDDADMGDMKRATVWTESGVGLTQEKADELIAKLIVHPHDCGAKWCADCERLYR